MRYMMKLILMALFITLPFFSQAQGQGQGKRFRIKIDAIEVANDSITDALTLPGRVDKFKIKKVKENNEPLATYTVQIGEEEQSFPTDGEYHDVIFTHDVRGLVVYILDENRNPAGKHFILRKRQ